MKSASSERRPEEEDVSSTAYGPADVRDTPHVKPTFPTADDPEDEDPWIGRVLSNVYEIEAKIGEGGMGSVYLARHVHLRKGFAIKVLSDSVNSKDNAVERLRQEAMAAARIDHENIVDVVNFDTTDDGAVFIVMEMLEGENLADCIGRGPIDVHRALPIAFQICRALHAAHEHEIVHRDLKPENVFLSEKAGRTVVKVLDFGISKIKSAEAEGVKMTKTGQLVGTPLYMSPEQARGESEVDRRVDVYAMGVMLFEMLTGAPPFEGRNYFELLWKHGNEEPPSMLDVNPNVFIPEAVDDVVLRALHKDRDARYQTMEELEQALMEAAPDVPALPPLPSLPPARNTGPVRPIATKRDAGRLGTAKTEQMASAERDAPTANETATADIALPRQKLTAAIAVAAGAALVLGTIVFVMMGGEDTVEPTTPEVAAGPETGDDGSSSASHDGDEGASGDTEETEATALTAPPRGVDPPPVPEPPAPVSVALSSTPAGAEVHLDGRLLGTTPLVAALPPAESAVELRFTKRGYLPETLSVLAVEGVEVPAVRLRRRRQASPSNETGTPLPIKTGL